MFSFKLLGFPVEIHLTFLLIVIFILDVGFSTMAVVLFVAAILVSVVLHELGHAVYVRRYGGHVHGIRIFALGGVTLWSEVETKVRGWRRFVVAAAGSGVGLILGLVLYAGVEVGLFGSEAAARMRSPFSAPLLWADDRQQYVFFFVAAFIVVSVFWGLLNWLPIGGLDGSKMLREVLIKVMGPRGDLTSRIVGVGVAAAAAYFFYQRGSVLAPILFLMFALSDLAAYQRRPQPQTYQPPPEEVTEGEEVE